jgi:DNA processing protein
MFYDSERRSQVRARDEQAALLALVSAAHVAWSEVAGLAEAVGSADRIIRGEVSGFDPEHVELANQLAGVVTAAQAEAWRVRLDEFFASHPEIDLITVLDADYPANLRRVYNRPPFLWIKGAIELGDDNAVAIVGTRDATPEGLRESHDLAAALASRGVTVISGLARGIDAAAHLGALDAGGRTLAVMGTGITRVYPPENAELAARITAAGGLISQFWPDSPPRRGNFPLRNVVTSGMAVGTVVIEASATSGAKMQARLALDHGKTLFLVERLVMQQEWARRYAQRPGAIVVKRADDVLELLEAQSRPEQLQFA